MTDKSKYTHLLKRIVLTVKTQTQQLVDLNTASVTRFILIGTQNSKQDNYKDTSESRIWIKLSNTSLV